MDQTHDFVMFSVDHLVRKHFSTATETLNGWTCSKVSSRSNKVSPVKIMLRFSSVPKFHLEAQQREKERDRNRKKFILKLFLQTSFIQSLFGTSQSRGILLPTRILNRNPSKSSGLFSVLSSARQIKVFSSCHVKCTASRQMRTCCREQICAALISLFSASFRFRLPCTVAV